MQAYVYKVYGTPEVLELKEIDKPIAVDDKVLVKVYATALNSADNDMLRGKAFGRFFGLWKPKVNILGSDVVGVVEAIGDQVKSFKVGDKVYGDMSNAGFSTFSDYICVADKHLHLKPEGLTYEQTAALPSAAVIALQGINKIEIGPGTRVLINGAGGGMGTYALQIAKALGAEVTGVDTGEKLDRIKSLGADHVLDYRKERFTKQKKKYHLILDCQSYHSIFSYVGSLEKGGVYSVIGGSLKAVIQAGFIGPILSKITKRKLGLLFGMANRRKDIVELEQMLSDGKFEPIIDRVFAFHDLRESFDYFEEGTFVGKVVIKHI